MCGHTLLLIIALWYEDYDYQCYCNITELNATVHRVYSYYKLLYHLYIINISLIEKNNSLTALKRNHFN